ncbi:MAG: hypothetical protein ACLFR1_01190 [Spirochaetia bacterium]
MKKEDIKRKIEEILQKKTGNEVKEIEWEEEELSDEEKQQIMKFRLKEHRVQIPFHEDLLKHSHHEKGIREKIEAQLEKGLSNIE